jgi:hypothetical protein
MPGNGGPADGPFPDQAPENIVLIGLGYLKLVELFIIGHITRLTVLRTLINVLYSVSNLMLVT